VCQLAALQLPGLWNVSRLSGSWARVAANWRRLKPHLQDLDVLRFQGVLISHVLFFLCPCSLIWSIDKLSVQEA